MARSKLAKFYVTAYSYYEPKTQIYQGHLAIDNKDSVPIIHEYRWVGMAESASDAAVNMLSAYFKHPGDVPDDLFQTRTNYNGNIYLDQRGHRNSSPTLDDTGSYIVSATVDDGSAQYVLIDGIVLDLYGAVNDYYDPFPDCGLGEE